PEPRERLLWPNRPSVKRARPPRGLRVIPPAPELKAEEEFRAVALTEAGPHFGRSKQEAFFLRADSGEGAWAAAAAPSRRDRERTRRADHLEGRWVGDPKKSQANLK